MKVNNKYVFAVARVKINKQNRRPGRSNNSYVFIFFLTSSSKKFQKYMKLCENISCLKATTTSCWSMSISSGTNCMADEWVGNTFARKHSIHFKIVLLIYYGLERLEISWYYYQNEKSTKLLTHELLPFIHTNQMRTIKIIIIIITIKDPENSIFFIFFGESASNTQTLQCHMQALHSKALHNHAVVLLSLCSGVILL